MEIRSESTKRIFYEEKPVAYHRALSRFPCWCKQAAGHVNMVTLDAELGGSRNPQSLSKVIIRHRRELHLKLRAIWKHGREKSKRKK